MLPRLISNGPRFRAHRYGARALEFGLLGSLVAIAGGVAVLSVTLS